MFKSSAPQPGQPTGRRGLALLFFLAAVVALVLLVAVCLKSRSGGGTIPVGLALLNAVGWGTCALLGQRASRQRVVYETAARLTHPDAQAIPPPGPVAQGLERISDILHGFESIARGGLVSTDRRLSEVSRAASSELGATSLEIALTANEADGSPPKILLLGTPSSPDSQSLLGDHGRRRGTQVRMRNRTTVITKPIFFSGVSFGSLRVELPEPRNNLEADVRYIRLLAIHIALILVDGKFTEEVIRMRRLSDESVRAKTGFLANLSHEIRGPLGVVMNAVELNLDGLLGELNEAQRETLEMVKINSNHLLDLVNDVLDYAKVEAGKITVTPATLEVKELLDELSRVVQTQAHAKKHDLHVLDVPQEWFVTCDRRHARQMLINLLTNAIKYTPEGGKIEVGAERLPDGTTKMWVKDSGVGIPFSERSKVFGAFERIESGYASQQTGTGLGMPLTRSLARVNGGTVDFDSEEGRGSTFWVVMPSADAPQADASQTSESEERVLAGHGVGTGERIVLFDPSDDTGAMVERYLSHQGFVVVRSTLAEQLATVVAESRPNLVVLDYDPAATEGENVLEALRGDDAAVQVPILLLTARAFLFDIEDSLRLGVDRCLTKPVGLKDLAAAIRSLLDETSRLTPEGEISVTISPAVH